MLHYKRVCTRGMCYAVRGSALEADSGRTIPCCAGGLILHQYRAWAFQSSALPAELSSDCSVSSHLSYSGTLHVSIHLSYSGMLCLHSSVILRDAVSPFICPILGQCMTPFICHTQGCCMSPFLCHTLGQCC